MKKRPHICVVHKDLAPQHAAYRIADYLRSADVEEFCALGLDCYRLAELLEPIRDVFYVLLDGEPVFVFALQPGPAHVRHLLGVGTDQTTRILPYLTRHIETVMIPHLVRQGVTRVEARLPASNEEHWLWLMSLGGRIETVLPGYGLNGVTMLQLGLHLPPRELSSHVHYAQGSEDRPS